MTIKFTYIYYSYWPFLLLISFLLQRESLSAQDSRDTISYCGFEVYAEDPCFAYSDRSIICGQTSIKWMYGELLPNMTELQYLNIFKENIIKGFKGETKELQKCTSFGWPLEASITTYEYPGGLTYQLVATGDVNHFAVFIHCYLFRNPKSTEDLPIYIQQFLSIN